MADFNKPNASSQVITLLSEIRENDSAVATQFKGVTSSNTPLDAVKFDAGVHSRWNGSAWIVETNAIGGGGTGSTTASGARTNLGVYSTTEVDGYISGVNATISAHTGRVDNPHSTTATQVGLGNVTNESKATMFTSPTFTGTVSGVTATMVGLGNVTNESKATMFTDPTFTGTVSGVSKSMVGLGSVENYGISDSTTLDISTSYASSKAVYDGIRDLPSDSVSTAAIQDEAVTSDKLAETTAERDWVYSRIAEGGPGTIGSYNLMKYMGIGTITNGSNIDGSNLRFSGAAGNERIADVPSGTYKCFGYADDADDASRVTLFLRIS